MPKRARKANYKRALSKQGPSEAHLSLTTFSAFIYMVGSHFYSQLLVK